MSDPRYPIGKFSYDGPPTTEQRKKWLNEIEQTPALYRAAVKDLNDKQLDTPYRDGGWTVRQLSHHIPDSHMNAYIRFKMALTEDAPIIKTYAEDRWAELPESKNTPIEMSLTMLELLHKRWVLVLRNMSEAEWKKTYVHPELGPMALEKALALYAWHGPHHTAHVTKLRAKMGW
jgi:uncharacterized damage-inducible protein DinB